MDEENPELRSLEQEAPATECLEEFVLGIPVKPYSEPSMSDVLSSSSSKKYSSNYHEASGAHHHLAASCSEVVFVFDGFQDKLRIRMLPFGEHRGNGSTAGLSKLFDVDLKNEVIVSGMSFFPYSAGSSYYGLILIPVESGAIYLYYLGEEGLVYHKETGQPLRAIFKLNAPAPPSAFEKSQIRPPLLNCMELTSSGRFGSISTAGASWREQGQSEHHNGNAIYTMKQEISVVAHYHFTGNIVQNNADTRLGLVLYRFYVDPDPLATDLPKEEARELIDGENITISIEKPGLGGLVRSIFSERSPSFNSRTVVESIRNLGDYLLGMILNCEGQYQACILNLKSCQVISKLDLPSIASDFAYDVAHELTPDATDRLRPILTGLNLHRVYGRGHLAGHQTAQRHLEAEQQTRRRQSLHLEVLIQTVFHLKNLER